MIVRGAPPEHYEWITSRIHLAVTPHFRAIEAVSDEGEIVAMAGFDGWTPNSVGVHFAFEKPCVALVDAALDFAFNQANRTYFYAITPSHKSKALRWAKHFGFKEVARIPNGWDQGDDLVISTLHRDDVRWRRKAA